mmetsp:Transcript_30994/g.67726  ORF Transcript_30994/g.67726 Transcript_30994/m.67726 type:complete len:219 (+) Transcript_30994:1479-2135(+)
MSWTLSSESGGGSAWPPASSGGGAITTGGFISAAAGSMGGPIATAGTGLVPQTPSAVATLAVVRSKSIPASPPPRPSKRRGGTPGGVRLEGAEERASEAGAPRAAAARVVASQARRAWRSGATTERHGSWICSIRMHWIKYRRLSPSMQGFKSNAMGDAPYAELLLPSPPLSLLWSACSRAAAARPCTGPWEGDTPAGLAAPAEAAWGRGHATSRKRR